MTTIVRSERRKRGVFGLVFKYVFILYNLAMLAWLLSYWVKVGAQLNQLADEASRAGGAIGATLGTGLIVAFWVAGAVVLGLFTLLTRGKTVIVEERVRSGQGR